MIPTAQEEITKSLPGIRLQKILYNTSRSLSAHIVGRNLRR